MNTIFLSVADTPGTLMSVDFYDYHDGTWMWEVYYCISAPDHHFVDIYTQNNNGVILTASEEF